MSKSITATAYLQLKADRDYWRPHEVNSARIMKVTQNKPNSVQKDMTVLKLRITVPVDVFEQIPVVDIELPSEVVTNIKGEVVPA